MRLGRGVARIAGAILVASVVALPPGVAAQSADGAGQSSTARSTISALQASAPRATFVRQRPCPDDSEFTCITLRVPRDQFGPPSPTFQVTFAIHRASSGHAIGTFVTVTGGPGTSGIAAADPYTAYFEPGIEDQFDLVFFDQRGIGQSEALQCPDAALAFYSSPHVPTISAREASGITGICGDGVRAR